jgi:lipoprotein-anchoring transpeptidase ErfK/SrfK
VRRVRTRQKQKQNWMPWLMVSGAVAGGAAFMLALFAVVAVLFLAPERVPNGVSVAGIEIGGKTLESAARALEQQLVGQTVLLADGDRIWNLSFAELGVQVDGEATAAAARQSGGSVSVMPVYTVDLSQAQTALFGLNEQVNIDAVPGNPPKIGRVMEIPVMLDRLRVNASGELADGVFELTMLDVYPPELRFSQRPTTATVKHIVQSGQELALIALEYGVTVEDIVSHNNLANPDLLYVGQELTIPAEGAYVPDEIPAAPLAAGKSILVSTSQQRIYAFENGELVRTHLTSTGLPATPTVLGDYNIYIKYTADDMSGPDYFLPQVPYTMYFYQGYAIHGTYWHNSFGRRMSHGCVNLPVEEAQWFFDWAEVGTLVRVV